MKEAKFLALVHVTPIESEDRPSMRIMAVEPTVTVYSDVDGRVTMVEVETKTSNDHETTETIFDPLEHERVFTARDLFQLLQNLGFQNVELIG